MFQTTNQIYIHIYIYIYAQIIIVHSPELRLLLHVTLPATSLQSEEALHVSSLSVLERSL